MASPWEKDLGTHQGRIQSDAAPEGSYVFELGHAQREAANLAIGDYREVKQTITIDPGAAVARVAVRIVRPPALPAGYGWLLTARLNGAVKASRPIRVGGGALEIEDFAIPLANANGPPSTDEIAFRLEVV